ncbi:efflux RND transporter periplasmic adaptor subunit [Litorivivens sp.]|uniref:efflux RND transporter periplasmic adaptor subunit n=1 Tax=Litorivivens sp. TaxID=2020868 RepID=UPI0035655816
MILRAVVLVLTLVNAVQVVAGDVYRHPVNIVQVAPQDSYLANRRFSGRAVAAQRSALAFELPGTVNAVHVENGDKVKQGDVLVELDRRLLEVQANEVAAALAEVQASLEKSERDLRRQQSLQSKGYSAQQSIDDLNANIKILSAQRERLRAQQQGVALRLEKSVLVAPFDGEVVAKAVDSGVIVKEGQPALELVETSHTEAVIGIPEVMKSSVSAGQTVTVSGLFGTTEAEVESVSVTVNPNTLTHSVRIRFPATTQVADGSIVYMLLDQRVEAEGFWLPLSALLEGYRGTWAVYTLNDQKVLEKSSVTPLYQVGERVFVSAGLAAGTQVVANGVHRYAAGQEVEVAKQ